MSTPTLFRKKVFASFCVLGLLLSSGFATPAKADYDDHRGYYQGYRGHERQEWREHEWREHAFPLHQWHRRYVTVYPAPMPSGFYVPGPVVYAPPPPVIYETYPQQQGINVVIPLHFH